MISSELVPAAPGPVQPRSPGKAAAGPAPDRPFEEFVEGAPKQAAGAGEAAVAEGASAEAAAPAVEAIAAEVEIAVEAEPGVEAADLLVLFDTAAAPEAAPAPAPAPVVVAAPTPLALATAAAPVSADAAETAAPANTAPAPAAPMKTALAPAAPMAHPIGLAGPTGPAAAAPVAPAVVGAAPEAADAPPPEVEGEADSEVVPRLHAAASVASALGGTELRPAAATPPAPFELALQPASAQSWRLSALAAADQGEAAREPARTPAPRDVAGQITVAIAQSTQPQVEIRLDPPELGRVQIRLNPTEHGLQATVFAERPETQDFLRRHAEVLRSDLGEAGYGDVSLDFAAGGEAAPRDAPEGERRLRAAYEPAAAPAAVREAPRRAAAAGLDIRL